jgi:hypothetical protein
MAVYFLVLDCQPFHQEILPALASSWQARSFEPGRALCEKVLTRARDFAERYYITTEPLLAQVSKGLPFNRLFWQHVAGELLWYSAVDIPEMQTSPETLTLLLAPKAQNWSDNARSQWPAIVQAHWGSRDLRIGATVYRPDQAGVNDAGDVARLSDYLNSIRPETWRAADLAAVPDLPEEEREEELAYLRDWFGPLQAMYAHAAELKRVIICETLE